MKKTVFLLLAMASILCYLLAAFLYYAHFSESNPGMMMVFLLPSLIGGLVFSGATLLLKDALLDQTSKVKSIVVRVFPFLMILGVVGLVYGFLN